VDAPEVLVTGGRGSLGRRVVDGLRDAGSDVRALSRSGHPGTVPGDLLTGAGLEQALAGVDAMVHCASSPRKTRQTDVEVTQRLLRAAARTGLSHIVFISIVGVDRNPYFPYYRMKLEVEKIVESSGIPWTILRATQFHDFALRMIRFLERLPIVTAPKGFLLQPIDVGEVANRLVELALSAPAGRVPDVGGPEVRIFTELARSYLEMAGQRRRVVEVPLPGKMARVIREGAQTCPDQAYGKIRWEEFLRQEIQRQRIGEPGGR
jgi:uncharacterized protein YbjT (DUF2867 family)